VEVADVDQFSQAGLDSLKKAYDLYPQIKEDAQRCRLCDAPAPVELFAG
jgi:hypothetical protein